MGSHITSIAGERLIDWGQTDLYRFFARVFAAPTRELFDFLAQPAASGILQALWDHLGCQGKFPGFNWFPGYDEYESAYLALFEVGAPGPAVPLCESAHDQSRPAQEIALENTYFYDVLGLKTDFARSVPDYLVTQLEFLAALRFTQENTLEESSAVCLARAKADFLERHLLNWVPAAAARLQQTGAPGFPVLMDMLVRFLREERAVA